MTPVAKYLPVLHRALDDCETEHPHWRIEVLVSLIHWPLQSLKHCTAADLAQQFLRAKPADVKKSCKPSSPSAAPAGTAKSSPDENKLMPPQTSISAVRRGMFVETPTANRASSVGAA